MGDLPAQHRPLPTLMISLAQAEMLVTDERQRSWSYVLEGQQLRFILERLRFGTDTDLPPGHRRSQLETAIDVLNSILDQDRDADVTTSIRTSLAGMTD